MERVKTEREGREVRLEGRSRLLGSKAMSHSDGPAELGPVFARRRSGAVADPVRLEPLERAVLTPLHGPRVLVHELVMERADQEQIVEVGSAAVSPPRDVVGLREPPRAATRESAFAVAVADLPHHPRRRLTSHAAEADHVARLALDHRLDTSVTKQTLERPWVDHRTSLDL